MVPLTAEVARRHTEHGEERKQQLLSAAAALFAESGYRATRIEDICRRAGVAKGLFYWYFPTKQALFEDLVLTMRHRLRRAQALGMDATADALTRLRQGTEASVRFIAEHATYFAFLDVERADGSHAALLRDGNDVSTADVRALIEEGQAAGLVADADPRLLALGVMGAVASFSHAWRNGRVPCDADGLAQFVGAWVVNAVAAPTPAHDGSAAVALAPDR